MTVNTCLAEIAPATDLGYMAGVLERCLQVQHKLLGAGELIEIKSQSEISCQSALLSINRHSSDFSLNGKFR